MDYFPDPAKDGVDHINIYSKGQTFLGKQLSNFAKTPFVHPRDGLFQSVEGYWYWLGCKNEELRHAHGYEAKKIGRESGAQDWNYTSDFQHQIKTAIACKIEQNPALKKLLKLSELPFRHYYVYQNKVIQVHEGQWIIDFIEEIRTALK